MLSWAHGSVGGHGTVRPVTRAKAALHLCCSLSCQTKARRRVQRHCWDPSRPQARMNTSVRHRGKAEGSREVRRILHDRRTRAREPQRQHLDKTGLRRLVARCGMEVRRLDGFSAGLACSEYIDFPPPLHASHQFFHA